MKNFAGFHVINKELLNQYIVSGEFTLIATGASRGGTSALGYLLTKLGFDLGVSQEKFYEDFQFHPKEWESETRIKEYISLRNTEKSIWGVKLPYAVFKLEFLATNLRNPIFLCIYRNPLSVMNSVINREKNFKLGKKENTRIGKALNHPLKYYRASLELFKINAPVLMVNYEEVQKDSNAFLRDFTSLMKLNIDENIIPEIAANLSRPGYKKL
jgi:hypothetical protein